MKRHILILATLSTLILPAGGSTAAAQSGNRQTGGSGGQRGSAAQAHGQQQGQGQGQGERSSQAAEGATTRAQHHLQVDPASRDRARDCAVAADRARQSATRLSRSRGLDGESARRQAEQLRQEVHTMLQQHDRFTQGLDTAQRQALHNELQQLERTRSRLKAGLAGLYDEVGRSEPNRDAIRSQARETTRSLRSWQKTYRQLDREAGIGLDQPTD